MLTFAIRLLILSLIFGSSLAASDTPEPRFTVRDYLALSHVEQPRFSPDGSRIAYEGGIRTTWDGHTDFGIYVTLDSGSPTMQLTSKDTQDWNPQWSPDGTQIAFKSNRSGHVQVHIAPASGGDAQQVTDAEEGVSSYSWAGDSRIAFVTRRPRDLELVQREEAAGGGYVVGTLARQSALWIQPVAGATHKTGVDFGNYHITELAVSPDGRLFALIVAPSSDLFERLTVSAVLIVDQSGKELYKFEDAKSFGYIGFSPDGRKISFVGSTVGNATNDGLFIADVCSGTTTNLTHDFDPTIRGVEWLDNRSLAFLTPRHVYSGIYKVSVDGTIETLVEPKLEVKSFDAYAPDRLLVFTATASNAPTQLYQMKFGGDASRARQITHINAEKKIVPQISSRVVRYASFDGVEIEAVVTLPPRFNTERKYPMLVNPHGGPDVIVMGGFNHVAQIFAHEGYIVFQPNFRGSVGYGREFYAANRGRLGDIDYQDIMTGVDHMLSRFPVDSERMVVGGESYGGTMTHWIVGHTDRFRAAVSLSGAVNAISRYGQSDINHGAIARWEFGGVPSENWETYWQMSPLRFLDQCQTPILILHPEDDVRVPVGQAWEAYRTLTDQGADVEMVLYPDVGHGFGSPDVFADVYQRWISWYGKYLDED